MSAPLPTVKKATNLYELLDEVVDAILEEPRRLDMRYYIVPQSMVRRLPDNRIPACGTVGCIAGWMAVLTHGETAIPQATHDAGDRASTLAEDMLRRAGVDGYDIQRFFMYMLDTGDSEVGTPLYTERVIDHIRAFQSCHRDKLIRTSIYATPTRKGVHE